MEPISTNNVAEQTVAAAPAAVAASVAATESAETTAATASEESQNLTATQTILDTATSQTPEQTEKTTSNIAYVGYVAVVILLVALIARLLRGKSKKAPKGKSNGKSGNPDMVEIYVGNLSYDMADAQLRREFERFGVVKSARVITHRTNGKSKGYGFVEMPHRKEAGIAIKALDNSDVMGRKIRVNEARANTRPPER